MDSKELLIDKDIFSNDKFRKEYELYQSFKRFNVYNVYKVYPKTNEKKFLYRITKQRSDYGRKLYTKREMFIELNNRLEVMNNAKKSTD